MRIWLSLVASILVISVSGTVSQEKAPQPRESSRAELDVRKLERAWLDAYEQRDVEAMKSIVADDFTITFPNGSIQDKSRIIDSLRTQKNPAGPSARYFTEEVQSRSYGDTVILIGRVVSEWSRAGKTTREQSRYTDTYVRRGERWQVVASHLSNVGKP